MWPISARLRAALAGDQFVATKVELLSDGGVTVDLSEAGVVVDGQIDVDNAEVRRSGRISLVDPSGALAPAAAGDPLAPSGAELRVWRGLLLDDGPELVPLATMRFVVVEANWPRLELECYDRAWTIAGATIEDTLTVAAGTNYVTAIEQVLASAWGPGLPTNFPDTDETTPALAYEAEADPWAIARELAANLGSQLFFDPMGVCQMVPEVDTATEPPVWVFDDRDDDDLMLGGTAATWDGTGPNAVIVIGENSDTGVAFRGVAYDLDPASPTQYGGAYGRRPLFLRDEKVTTQFQATMRARKELLRRLGISQQVTVNSMVNPALEVGDVVEVHSERRKLAQLCILERFGVPLRASGTMALETRARQVVA